jgi:flavin reductase (DIM6/NTAB) family NADH-FMN oxidoreductase RutF
VVVLTVRDGRDDLGTTVTSFMSVSLDPPLVLASEPHHRGELSGALIPESGLTAFECETRQCIEAGDHTLFTAEVLSTDYVSRERTPLIRVNRRYLTLP